MKKLEKLKGAVFDFSRTIYNPESAMLESDAIEVLEVFSKHFPLMLYYKKGKGRDNLVSSLGIEKFFIKILSVNQKSPVDFVEFAKNIKAHPSEILVIGDRVNSEIATGKQAGCMTAWYCKGKFEDEKPQNSHEQPDITVYSLAELPEHAGIAKNSNKDKT